MGIAESIIDRSERLAQDRHWWEAVWRDIAANVLPMEPDFAYGTMMNGQLSAPGGSTGTGAPNSPNRVKTIYDNTGMVALDRLTAGMDSLVTPMSEKWHGLSLMDMLGQKPTTEERIYLERLRDFQFHVRYDPRAGFIPAHQRALRSCIALGTGVYYIEQGDGKPRAGDPDTAIRYQFVPLSECLLATNSNGTVDTNYRVRSFTVKQLVDKFGIKKVSQKIRTLFEEGKALDETVTVIHAVCPREEAGSNYLSRSVKKSRIASYYIERDTKHVLSDSGFYEFPFPVYHWNQVGNGPYAESPVMLALSEIKSLQLMGKGELRAFAQWTDPPMGMFSDGVMNRPNLNPGKINYGAIGPNGEKRLQPILTNQNPDFAEKVMDVRRNMVNNTMYVNLFQILIKNPEMSATEAMLRANEKGELLGPAGGKIQMGLSVAIDRELGVLERKGIWEPNSALAPPESMRDKAVSVKFTSPLDRLRRMNEAVGTVRLLEAVVPLAKVKPKILDKLDEDQIIDNLTEIYGAPANTLVTDDVLKKRRAQTDADAQKAKGLMEGQGMAEVAKTGSIAARNIGEMAEHTPAMQGMLNKMLQGAQAAPGQSPASPTPDGINALLSQFGAAPSP